MQIKEFFKTNKTDLINLSALFLLFTFFLILFWGHLGNVIIDCAKEGYISQQMLKGKLLYRDLNNVYGPLGYQLNALLFYLFGVSFNTLYMAGALNALTVLGSGYFIAKNFVKPAISFLVGFLFITILFFNPHITNYIFPYSYSMLYSLSSFLLSVLFCINFIKKSNFNYALLSSLFFGFSLASKYDFLFFSIPLFLVFVCYKRLNLKQLLLCFAAFISTPLMSWGTLFLQGFTFNDFINLAYYIHKALTIPVVKHFYSTTVGMYFDPSVFVYTITSFLVYSTFFIIMNTIFYLYSGWKTNKIIKTLGISSIILISQLELGNIFFFYDIAFSWLPLFTLGILAVVLFNEIKIDIKNRKIDINKDKIPFIFLILSALTSVVKCMFYIQLNVYGSFLLALPMVVYIIFLCDYLPGILTKLNKEKFEYSIKAFGVLLGILFISQYSQRALFGNNVKLESDKGAIYTNKTLADSLNKSIDYINKNIPANKSFLMMPEGPILNFITSRDTKSWNIYTIPGYIQVQGEDNIIKELKKNSPDYIFINNRDSSDTGYQYICQDYGFKICDYVDNHYQFEERFGENFVIKIYRKK